ncbi:MAG: hypothetical protein GX993_02745 [Bacteroidales bacterium]|nr:hypothetical protein [Bacteroidales bacterium]
MKQRLSSIITAIVLVLSLTGCFNQIENELGHISRRIKAMEDNLQLMNENVSTLQTLVNRLNSYDFVSKITRIYNNYEVIGYTISFTNSPSITIYNGKDAQTPVIGVKKAEDGIFYWVVSYGVGHEEYVTNNVGQKIPAVAVTPKIKIENGYWMVSYDKGVIWHNLGKATGDAGTSFIRNVTENDGYVQFNFLDGSNISIPTLETYDTLNEAVNRTNSNLASLEELISLVNQGVYAKNIKPIIEKRDTIGYKLFLSDSTVMTFYNGVATTLPTIGAAQDIANPADSNFYWTIKYESDQTARWILLGGKKVRVTPREGTMPMVGLKKHYNGVYYWTISYDSGTTYDWLLNDEQEKVPAAIPEVNIIITAITNIDANYIELTMGDQKVLIPRYVPLTIDIQTTCTMGASATLNLTYTITGGSNDMDLLPIAQDGFYARVIKSSVNTGTLTIYSPATFTQGMTSELVLLISDGLGSLKNIIITIKYGA